MFNQLTERLNKLVKNWRGQARLTEENIQAASRDIRMALLEADVALPVIKAVIENIKIKALGQEVATSLNPGQAFIKIVRDELTLIMGSEQAELNLNAQPPAIILMAGLQGAGKTTTAAKLARYLKEKQKKSVFLVSVDVYRPAAMQQLANLAKQLNIDYFDANPTMQPLAIAAAAIDRAQKQHYDVLIIDTAGRLAIDQEMMAEIKDLHAATNPIETLFVVDSMTGQDAANTANAFNAALPLTGVILTKADGDARGGAALSVRHITGKPIKFIGTGEKTDALELFHPERMASQILGMGDVLSLIETIEQHVDREKTEKIAQKLKQGKRFTLVDFAEQLQQMQKMGGLNNLLGKLPGVPQLPNGALNSVSDQFPRKMLAMINSMTKKERLNPDLIKASRKIRIAQGSGTQVQDVNRLLKQFLQLQTMMKKVGKNPMKLKQMMQQAQHMRH